MSYLIIEDSLMLMIKLSIILLYLIVAAIYDYKSFKIPNKLTLSLIIITLVLHGFGVKISITNLYGFILGWMLVFIPAFLMNQPMGGDMKLLSSIGFIGGYEVVIQIMVFTLIIGLPIAIYHRFKVGEKKNIPFAVLLLIGYIVLLLFNIVYRM